eukprot:jgi/Mesvir1/15878/Mv22373-RA.1
MWNKDDVDGALRRFYHYAFDASPAFGQVDLANDVVKFTPMTRWAKAVKSKSSSLDRKYMAAAFNSSAAIPELKKAFWSIPVDLPSAMTLLDVLMNHAATLTSEEANNAVDLAFCRDQVTLFLSKPGNSSMHANMKKMALDTKTFTEDVLTEWMNYDRDNVSYNGQIRTSRPTQTWGVSNNVTWTNFGLNVIPAGSSSDSLTSPGEFSSVMSNVMMNSGGSTTRGVTEEDVKRRVRLNRSKPDQGLGVMGWFAIAALVAGVVALVYYSKEQKTQPTSEFAFVGGGPVPPLTPTAHEPSSAAFTRMGQTSGVPSSKSDFFSTFNSFLG